MCSEKDNLKSNSILKNKLFESVSNVDILTTKTILITSNYNIWESVDNNGFTCLILACNINNKEIIEAILNIVKKKLVDDTNLSKWINLKADNGFNALHYSAYRGNLEAIKLLVKFGCNLDIKNDNGLNIMHLAAQGNQPNVLVYLMYNYGFCTNATDNSKSSCLHWASYSGSDEVFDYIISLYLNSYSSLSYKLNLGNILNLKDNDGFTPLHLASLMSNKNIIRKLIVLQANFNIKDNIGRTPDSICKYKNDDITSNYINNLIGLSKFKIFRSINNIILKKRYYKLFYLLITLLIILVISIYILSLEYNYSKFLLI